MILALFLLSLKEVKCVRTLLDFLSNNPVVNAMDRAPFYVWLLLAAGCGVGAYFWHKRNKRKERM